MQAYIAMDTACVLNAPKC